MSSFTTISDIPAMNSPEEFVQELIKMKANVRIYDFMLELKARFYPNVNMILYEDFSQYVGRDHEFCIDARMYYKYSKLLVPGYKFDLKTCDPRSHIIRVLNNSKMEKGVNYLLSIDGEQSEDSRGIKYANHYMMNPESFYLLLMDIPDRYSQARRTFCKYHSFQTKVIKYYDNFQIGLAKLIDEEKQKMLSMKDDKIDNLEKKIDNQNEKIDKQSSEIQELLSYAKNTSNKLNEVSNELSEAHLDIQDGIIKIEDLTDTVDELNEKVEECREVITERLEDHTINPKSITKRQYFTCLESPEYANVLYVIRSQKSNIRKQLKDHKDWEVLIEPIEDPNSIKMFNRFKERMYNITKDWKSELRSQKRNKEITHDEYDAKIAFMKRFPLIRIRRNLVDFDYSRISTEEIIKLMKDTTFKRFTLRIP